MRAVRTTSVSCGLLNVPIKLYKTSESHDVSFRQHHAGCGGGIAMTRSCKECESDVPFADIVKGIEYEGELVLIQPEELKSLESESSPAVEILHFIDLDEVDPLSFEASYYAAPDKTSAKGYALLRQGMVDEAKAALVKFSIRTGRESLGVLRVSGNLLVLHTIAWPDEIREPEFAILDKPVALKPKEVEMARAMVESMTEPFVAGDHVDTYTGRVRELIAARAAGEEFEAHPVEMGPVVDDLIAALEATIAKRKKKIA